MYKLSLKTVHSILANNIVTIQGSNVVMNVWRQPGFNQTQEIILNLVTDLPISQLQISILVWELRLFLALPQGQGHCNSISQLLWTRIT